MIMKEGGRAGKGGRDTEMWKERDRHWRRGQREKNRH